LAKKEKFIMQKLTRNCSWLVAICLLGLVGCIGAGAQSGGGRKTLTNSIGITFVSIEPGTFMMGSPTTEADRDADETQHRVTISKHFMMGTTHVTVAQFRAFVNATGYVTEAQKQGTGYAWTGSKWEKVKGATWLRPGFAQGDDHPVVDVSWNDAMAFCDWLSKTEGRRYRLPTEAEWEYCCRAGTTTTYWWGDTPDGGAGHANCADATARARYPNWPGYFNWTDGYVFTSPVGHFAPNAWGIYDMTGNAWEWCSDWYGKYPEGDVTDPQGPTAEQATQIRAEDSGVVGPQRVMRGGSWHSRPKHGRCALRDHELPSFRNCIKGFRVVLEE
jgi:formylglycine-generating enzyme required for sulfatase activity